MILRRGAAALLLAATAAVTGPLLTTQAEARENRALIVGVTEYPQLPKSTWLVGPGNDAVLVRDYLTTRSPVRFDPANVTVLADGVEGAQEPTLAAILAALDDLAAKAAEGDFIYLQLSGHGFQQTAADPSTETDGLDEIFLPKDTGRWVDRSKGMPNVLTDDVIGGKLDAIRAKGAFVWFVIDACHSGTATRAAPGDDVVERKIAPGDVGMPGDVLTEHGASTRSLDTPVEPPVSISSAAGGGMVAFFAAQTNETTPEMPLPAGMQGASKYGLFTHTLFSKLAENPKITYRQLAEGILQHYSGINRTSTTPLFEGDLDAPVFGTEVDAFVPQWPIAMGDRGVTVSGGLLHGLLPGTQLAVVPQAGSRDEEAIGLLQVRSADNFSARLALVPPPPKAEAMADAPARKAFRTLGDVPAGAYARLVESTYDFILKVAKPAPSASHPEASARVDGILAALAADDRKPYRIELVEPGKPADMRLAIMAEAELPDASFSASADPALWFLPESGELSTEEGRRPPSIIMQSGDPVAIGKAVSDYLRGIYRATNLARIGQGSDFGDGDLDVAFTLERKPSGDQVPISSTSVPLGVPGDSVSVRAKNQTGSDVDVNILYVGSDYSITFMGNARLKPGATLERRFLEFTNSSYGRELMVAVLTEAPPLTPTLDLRFLQQDGLRSGMTRGDNSPLSVAEMIQTMGQASATRAAKAVDGSGGKPRGSVMLFPVKTVPKP